MDSEKDSKDEQPVPGRKLVPVIIGSKRHIDLLRAGYRTHHVEGNTTWLEYCRPVSGGATC